MRVVKTMGDSVPVESTDPLIALQQAIVMQTRIAEHEANLPEGGRFRFRVGINRGEVVLDGDDLLGDLVNMAVQDDRVFGPRSEVFRARAPV